MTRQVNRSRRKSKTLGALSGPPFVNQADLANKTAADELRLYAENTSELYGQKVSILKNIARRLKNGTYNASLAPKLWMYWVDAAARRYCKEFGGPEGNVRNSIFDKPTREYLARELATDMLSEAREYMT